MKRPESDHHLRQSNDPPVILTVNAIAPPIGRCFFCLVRLHVERDGRDWSNIFFLDNKAPSAILMQIGRFQMVSKMIQEIEPLGIPLTSVQSCH